MKTYIKPEMKVASVLVMNQMINSSPGTLSVQGASQDNIVGDSREFDDKMDCDFWNK